MSVPGLIHESPRTGSVTPELFPRPPVTQDRFAANEMCTPLGGFLTQVTLLVLHVVFIWAEFL